MVGRVVTHVPNTENFKLATVHLKNVDASLVEDGALSELCPCLPVPKTAALAKVPDQVNKSKLHADISHELPPGSLDVIQV